MISVRLARRAKFIRLTRVQRPLSGNIPSVNDSTMYERVRDAKRPPERVTLTDFA